MDAEALTNAVNVLGKENVILQIASEQLRREVLNGDSPRHPGGGPEEIKIPVPTTPGSNSALQMMTSSYVGMVALALGALLL